MKARAIALIAAATIALLGVVAVVLYAQGANSRAVAGVQPQAVYVSSKIVPAGTTLSDAVKQGLLSRTNVPAESKPTGALTDVGPANKDLVATNDIQAGEFVLSARFGTSASGSKAIEVPTGQVAVSAQLSDPAKLGSFMTPGSRIVIYDTHDTVVAGGATTAETQILLQDVLVIAVGNSSLTPVANASTGTTSASSASSTSVLVTVAVPPEDATRLVHGIQTGRLYAGLRGTGAKVDPAAAVSDGSLFAK